MHSIFGERERANWGRGNTPTCAASLVSAASQSREAPPQLFQLFGAHFLYKHAQNSTFPNFGSSVVRDGCSAAKLHTSFFLKNGSSWPRISEAANRGKHAYPESGLQVAENSLGEELYGTD